MSTISVTESPQRGGPVAAADVSWVLLTMGDRPDTVARAVNQLLANEPPPGEVVVVGNGYDPAPEFAGTDVVTIATDENVGIPAGRNIGARRATGRIIAFLDDDAQAPDPALTGKIAELFATKPTLGAVSMRICDPETGESMRRHVPTLGGRYPEKSRWVTTFLGGASAVRSGAFWAAGGLPDAFFYAHEETDLAWRLLDAGWKIRYAAELVVLHPASVPGRHQMAARLTARNRVWLARRNLPAPLALIYLADWLGLTVARRSFPMVPFLSGWAEGMRTPCGERRPIRWRTAWAMTRLGRPPLL